MFTSTPTTKNPTATTTSSSTKTTVLHPKQKAAKEAINILEEISILLVRHPFIPHLLILSPSVIIANSGHSLRSLTEHQSHTHPTLPLRLDDRKRR